MSTDNDPDGSRMGSLTNFSRREMLALTGTSLAAGMAGAGADDASSSSPSSPSTGGGAPGGTPSPADVSPPLDPGEPDPDLDHNLGPDEEPLVYVEDFEGGLGSWSGTTSMWQTSSDFATQGDSSLRSLGPESPLGTVTPGRSALESYYPLDGDAATNEITGTDAVIQGNVTTGEEGIVDSAFGFNSTSVTQPAVIESGTNLNGQTVTVGGWFKYQSHEPYARAFQVGADPASTHTEIDGSWGWDIEFEAETNSITLVNWSDGPGASQVAAGPTLETDTWYFVVAVLDGDDGRLHVFDEDGELGDSPFTGSGARDLTDSEPLLIGAGDDRRLQATIDDVYAYTSALTEEKVTQLYNASVDKAADTLEAGLEAYLPLDGSTPTNQVTGTDATVVGSPSTGEGGVLGDAFGFSQNDTLASAQDAVVSEPLPINGDGVTVGAWVNFTDHESAARVFQTSGDPNSVPADGFNVEFDGGSNSIKMVAWAGSGFQGQSGTISIEPGTWYYVVVSIDGTNHRLQVFDQDGELDASPVTADLPRSQTDAEPLVLMAGDGQDTTGRMDEVRAYSRALSPGEVGQLVEESGGPATGSTGDKYLLSMPGDGLDAYPHSLDKWGFDVRDESGSGLLEVQYAVKDQMPGVAQAGKYYTIQHDVGDNEIQVFKGRGPDGEYTELASASVRLDPYEWYTYHVNWMTGGNVEVLVTDAGGNEVATLNYQDFAYNRGGIGFWTPDGEQYVDNVNVRSSPARTDDGAIKPSLRPKVSTPYGLNCGGFLTGGTATMDGLEFDNEAGPGVDVFGDASASGNDTAVGNSSTGDSISGTENDLLYQSELYGGDLGFDIAIPNGTYEVTLHFAETAFTSDGSRVFDVSVQGEQVVEGLDIHSEVGHDAAYTITVDDVEVTNGSLEITSTTQTDNTKFSGIEIREETGMLDIPYGLDAGGSESDATVTIDGLTFDESPGEGVTNNSEVPDSEYPDFVPADPGYATSTTGDDIAETDNDPLYQTELFGPDLGFDFAVPNGTYDVTLHFAENFHGGNDNGGGDGSRVFDLAVQGQTIAEGYDIHAEVGHDAATTLTVRGVEVGNNVLSVSSTTQTDYTTFSGIEIRESDLVSAPFGLDLNGSATGRKAWIRRPGQGIVVFDKEIPPGVTVTSEEPDGGWPGFIPADPGYSQASSNAAISGTIQDSLYQTEIFSNNLGFEIEMPNGNYDVYLHNAETNFDSAGGRVFDISVQGTQIVDNYDIYDSVGGETADVVTVRDVEVTDNTLTISTVSESDFTKFAGIEIREHEEPKVSVPYGLNAGGTDTTGTVTMDGLEFDNDLSEAVTAIGDQQVSTYTADIAETDNDLLYQSVLYGSDIGFEVNVPNGIYEVTLHFAENFHTAEGDRVFDIWVQDDPVASNYDIYASAGANTADTITVQGVEVRNGTLSISTDTDVDNTKIAGFEIREQPDVSIPYGLNTGGGGPVSIDGLTFADAANESVAVRPFPNTGSTGDSISDTENDALYQSEHWGNHLQYDFRIENGTYDVTLHFVEMTQTAEDVRVFDVLVQGEEVADDLDIYAEVGHDAAYTIDVEGVEVTDRELEISTLTSSDNSQLSGIEIRGTASESRDDALSAPYGLNCAGDSTVEIDGLEFDNTLGQYAEGYFVGGVNSASVGTDIANTEHDALYQTENWYRGIQYDFYVPDGTYDVTLHFAETAFGGTEARVFDVWVQDELVADDLDLVAEVGANTAYTVDVDQLTVDDGKITVKGLASVNNAKFSGIEIREFTPSKVETPYGLNAGGTGTSGTVEIDGLVYDNEPADGVNVVANDDNINVATSTDPVAGTDNDLMFQSELWGPDLGFEVGLENGVYDLTLYFAETVWGDGNDSNNRIFDLYVQGERIRRRFDPLEAAGHDVAIEITVEDVQVTDEVLEISTRTFQDNTKFSGFEIREKPQLSDPYGLNAGGDALEDDPLPLMEGLEAYYSMDGDEPVNAVTGEAANVRESPITNAEGVVNDAFEFTMNGNSGDRAGTVGDAVIADGLEMNGEEVTFGAWVNMTNHEPWARLIQVGGAPDDPPFNGWDLEFDFQADTFLFASRDEGANNLVPAISQEIDRDTWYYVVVAIDGDDVRLHMFDQDGELDDSPKTASVPERPRTGEEPLILMAGDRGDVAGRMDEVRTYSRALSESEVSDLYEASFTPTPPLRVSNAGTEFDNQVNAATDLNPISEPNTASTGADISGTEADAIYQTEHWGNNLSYEFYIENGSYDVTLHFAETVWSSEGARVFDVMVNGETVAEDLDIYAEVGQNAAYTIELLDVEVTDRTLTIETDTQADNSKFSGIEIRGQPNEVVEDAISAPFGLNAGGASVDDPPTVTIDGLTFENEPTDEVQAWQDGGTVNAAYSGAEITNSPDDERYLDYLYQTEHWSGGLEYRFRIPNGHYDVTLHFAETAMGSEGARVFDAYVQGEPVATDLDIYAEVGGNAAYTVTAEDVPVVDGVLRVAGMASVNNVSFSGIEIRGAGVVPPYGINAGGTGTTGTAEFDGLVLDNDPVANDDVTMLGGGPNVATTGNNIVATQNDLPYQSELWGQDLGFEIQIPDGTYEVTLHFAETAFTSAGSRVFDLMVQGRTVVSGMDIYNRVGHDVAYPITLKSVEVTDGTLSITTNSISDNTKFSAIEVRRAGEPEPPLRAFGESPAKLIFFDEAPQVASGSKARVEARLTNPYLFDLLDGEVELSAPSDDWEITPMGGTSFDKLESRSSQTVQWMVEAPVGVTGDMTLTADVSYESGSDAAEVTVTQTIEVADATAGIPTGLAHYFPLDGDTAADQITGIEATAQGNVTTGQPGLVNDAFGFSGSGAAVVAPGTALNTEEVTVSGWFKFQSHAPYARIFQVGGDPTVTAGAVGGGWDVEFNAGDDAISPVNFTGGSSQTGISMPVDPDTWYFVVVVLDGDDVRFHLFDKHGELDASPMTGSGARSQSDAAPLIMMSGDSRAIDGTLDEVRAYDSALSTVEVSQLYRGSLNPPQELGQVAPAIDSLEAYYAMDGDTATNVITGTDATAVGEPTAGAEGLVGEAFSFEAGGANSPGDGFQSEDLPLNAGAGTVAGWFNFSGHDDYGRVLQVGGASDDVPESGYQIRFDAANDTLLIETRDGDSISEIGSAPVDPDTWYFAVAVMEEGGNPEARLHIFDQDGEIDGSPYTGSASGWATSASDPLFMMSGGFQEDTSGRMDQVFAYSTALTAGEVASLYEASQSPELRFEAPATPPAGAIEAYLSLDDPTPTNAITGTAASTPGGPTADVDGFVDDAYFFTQNDDTGSAADAVVTEDLDLLGEASTVAGWFRFSDHEDWARLVQVGGSADGTPGAGWNIEFDGGDNQIYITNWGPFANDPSTNISLDPNQWYFLIVIVDGDEYRMHAFNEAGQLPGSPVTYTFDRTQAGSAPLILMSGDGRDTTGRMDEVRAYSRALYPNEALELYQATLPDDETIQDDLESYYTFDGDAPVNEVTGTEATIVGEGEPETNEPGLVGDAFRFSTNGTRGSVAGAVVEEDTALNGPQATLGAWINITGHEDYGRVYQVGGSESGTPGDAGWDLEFNAGSNEFRIVNWAPSGLSVATPNLGIELDTWYFIVTVVDGNDIRLHVYDQDGEIDASPVEGSGLREQTGAEDLILMSGDNSDTAGLLDETYAFSTALSESQVASLWEASGTEGGFRSTSLITDRLVAQYDANAPEISTETPLPAWPAATGDDDLAQSTAMHQPTYTPGATPSGKPAVRFEGFDDEEYLVGDSGSIENATSRFADATSTWTYEFDIPEGTSDLTATLDIDNEFLVSARAVGTGGGGDDGDDEVTTLPTVPSGWSTNTYSGSAEHAYVDGESSSGDRSVRISSEDGSDASWGQFVQVEQNTEYTITANVKTENLQAVDGTGQDGVSGSPLGAAISIGNVANSQYPDVGFAITDPLTGTNDWTEVSVTVDSGDFTEFEVLGLFGGYGQSTGTVWFDDIRVEDPDGNNILANSGFEGAMSTPDDWETNTWGGTAEYTYDGDEANSGDRSLQISSSGGADAVWRTTVPVEEDTEYTLGGYIKTEDVQNTSGAFAASFNVDQIGGAQDDDVVAGQLTGTNDWTEVSTTLNSGGNTELTVNCLLGGFGFATGSAWYDDIYLEDPDGNNLLPNSGFEEGFLAGGPPTTFQPVLDGRDFEDTVGSGPTEYEVDLSEFASASAIRLQFADYDTSDGFGPNLYGLNLTADGETVVEFDVTGDFMTSETAVPTGLGATITAVFRIDDHEIPRQTVAYNGSDGAGNGFGIFVNKEGESSGLLRVLYGGVSWWASDMTVTDDDWHIATLTVPEDGSAPSLYLDGTELNLTPEPGGTANAPTDQFGIGQDGNTGGNEPYVDGDVAEVVNYDAPLSDANRESVEASLARKWFTADLPTQGLVAQYDAQDADLDDGAAVSEWSDSVGDVNITQSTTDAQPTYVTDVTDVGGPAVRFEGDGDSLTGDSPLPTGLGATISARFRIDDHTVPRQVVAYNGSDDAGSGFGIFVNQEEENIGHVRALYGGVTWWASGTTIQDDEWHTATLTVPEDGSAPSLYLDGSELSLSGGGTAVEPSDQFGIGQDANSLGFDPYIDGDVAEVVAYDRVLTDDERKTLEGYLEPPSDLDADPQVPDVPQLGYVDAYYSLDGDEPINLVTDTKAEEIGQPTTGVEGYAGNAFEFTTGGGVQDALRSGEALPINGEEFTVSGWLNYTSHEGAARFFQLGGNVDSVPTNGFSLEMGNDDLYPVGWNGGAAAVGGPSIGLSPDTWHLVVLSCDGDDFRLHVFDEDGELDASPVEYTLSRGQSGSEVLNMMAGDGNEVEGRLDEVFAYSTALSAGEVLDLASVQGVDVDESMPATDAVEAYYSLDGDTATNGITLTNADVTGDPTTGADGIAGSAWEFTQDDDRSSTIDALTSGEGLPINGEGVTVATWFQFSSHEDWARIYQAGGDVATPGADDAWELIFVGGSNDLRLFANGSGDFQPPLSLSPDTWYFLVTTIENNTARIQVFDQTGEIDASPVRTEDFGRSTTGPQPLVMMSGDDSEPSGLLDQVFAYSTALSQSDVAALYENSFTSYGIGENRDATPAPTEFETVATAPEYYDDLTADQDAPGELPGERVEVDLDLTRFADNGTIRMRFADYWPSDGWGALLDGMVVRADGEVIHEIEATSDDEIENYLAVDEGSNGSAFPWRFADADSFWVYEFDVPEDALYVNATLTIANGFEVSARGVESTSSGLSAYYPLDGDSPTDASENGNDATINGDPDTGASGAVDGAYAFDGDGDYLTLPEFAPSGDSVTIATWVNFDNLDSDQEIAFWGDDAPQFELWYSGSTLQFIYWDGSSTNGLSAPGVSPPVNEWVHLAATYDDSDGTWTLYMNGEAVASTTQSVDTSFNGSSNQIGDHPNQPRQIDGRMDDVRLYERALSSDTINDLFAMGPAPTEFQVEAIAPEYYDDLDEGQDAPGSLPADRVEVNLDLSAYIGTGAVQLRFEDYWPSDGWGGLLFDATVTVDGETIADFADFDASQDADFLVEDSGSQTQADRRYADNDAYWIYEFDVPQDADSMTATLGLANGFRVLARAVEPVAVGLTARYPFDGDSPTDAVGDNDGTIGGDVTTGASGADGSAFDFDGDDDYVHYPDVDATYDGSGDWATSIWLNPDTLTSNSDQGDQYFWHPRGQSDLWAHINSDDEIAIGTWDGNAESNLSSGVTPTTGEWTHVCIVSDTSADDQYRIFVDGTEEATGNLGDPVVSDDTNVIGGQFSGGFDRFYYDGRIDEVRLYDRALSADTIGTLAGTGGN